MVLTAGVDRTGEHVSISSSIGRWIIQTNGQGYQPIPVDNF
jgi:hypothetical protein